jgi:ABC-type phosphate transport system substrate-binding protein
MAVAVCGPTWWTASAWGGETAPAAAAAVAAEADGADTATADPLAELASLRYQPRETVADALRLAGSTTLEQAASAWAEGFRLIHPEMAISIEGAGSEAGWRALLEGRADVALMSRPLLPEELEQAAKRLGDRRRVVAITVAFDGLTWIVHPDNPVAALAWSPDVGILAAADPPPSTAAQGAAPAAPPTTATRWRQLAGPTAWPADWTDVPIRMHATDLQSGTRWHLDRLASGPGTCPLEVTEHATMADVAAAVAADRGGLGLVGTRTAWPGVRAVSLEIPADAVPLPDAVVGSTRPPTLRPLILVVAVPVEGEWPAALHEFVAYVLSYFGQLDVAKDGLLPLSRAELHAQRELLGWAVQR